MTTLVLCDDGIKQIVVQSHSPVLRVYKKSGARRVYKNKKNKRPRRMSTSNARCSKKVFFSPAVVVWSNSFFFSLRRTRF